MNKYIIAAMVFLNFSYSMEELPSENMQFEKIDPSKTLIVNMYKNYIEGAEDSILTILDGCGLLLNRDIFGNGEPYIKNYVLLFEGKITAFMQLIYDLSHKKDEDKSIKINLLAVDKGLKRKGLGTLLIKRAKRKSDKYNLPLSLFSTQESVPFYKENGFTTADNASFHYIKK